MSVVRCPLQKVRHGARSICTVIIVIPDEAKSRPGGISSNYSSSWIPDSRFAPSGMTVPETQYPVVVITIYGQPVVVES